MSPSAKTESRPKNEEGEVFILPEEDPKQSGRGRSFGRAQRNRQNHLLGFLYGPYPRLVSARLPPGFFFLRDMKPHKQFHGLVQNEDGQMGIGLAVGPMAGNGFFE